MKMLSFLKSKEPCINIITLVLIHLTLGFLDRVYYNFTREALINEQVEKMRLEASNISISIQLSRKGEKVVEDLIGQNLRSAALFAQSNLNPDIEKVSNEDLDKISKKIGVSHITLMKRSGNDIIGYKSDEPEEIGMSTKGWRGYWYQAFNELLNNKNTTVPVGQILPNYWAGPINTSMTDPHYVNMWGYYYDGTTNYIIDPFVHDTVFRNYQKETGVDALINQVVADNSNAVEEVTVFNPLTFLKEQEQFKKNGVVWYSDREILFGTYNYQDQQDSQYIKHAYESNREVSFESNINGKDVLKSYIPLHLELPVVVGLVSNTDQIDAYMSTLLSKMQVTIGIATLITVIGLYLISRYYTRSRLAAAESVQDVFVSNVDQLFTSIKEQRHDFNNHIATIQSLVTNEEYDELKKFTKELVGETTVINDIIKINSPALCALIQSKITEALDRKISFDHEMIGMDRISLDVLKSTDLVKIVSNLIDNAFEAVEQLEEIDRIVELTGSVENDRLCFKIYNKGVPIPDAHVEKLFEKGYSTKKEKGKNSGLGLFIVHKILEQYNGRITVDSKQDGNTFSVEIPM
ncbi:GHKL domain-containing protein [Paenibacillus oralis]|uniref:histidine kinase n=1 Tax=Paenibacillus oralis TaxID=2490856 RepID=A0A3P3T9X9_9BACL|nr:ATP-binding protein [Paenibacillus oralis]RRJ54752.1 GHKL domain-containing protein [Paenibacillus oralis]